MSERRGAQTAQQDRRGARKIPPLVWIVLGLLVAWFVVAMLQRGGTHVTPGGETVPQVEAPTAVMPPTPPGPAPGVPGTPGGLVTPDQPTPAPAPR